MNVCFEGTPVNITAWTLKLAMDVVGHMLLQLDLFALEGKQDNLLQCLLTILHRYKRLWPDVFQDFFKRFGVHRKLKV